MTGVRRQTAGAPVWTGYDTALQPGKGGSSKYDVARQTLLLNAVLRLCNLSRVDQVLCTASSRGAFFIFYFFVSLFDSLSVPPTPLIPLLTGSQDFCQPVRCIAVKLTNPSSSLASG